MNDTTKTGWVAYQICDRSGGNFDVKHYLYLPWAGEDCEDETREHIVMHHESWAVHAESYTFDLHLNVVPPKEEVNKYIGELRVKARNATLMADRLEATLKDYE